MISLTRLSGSVFALNADLIERVDSTPDTVITLIDGTKYVVAESMPAVIAIVRRHRAEVMALSGLLESGGTPPHDGWPGRQVDAPGPLRRPNLQVIDTDESQHGAGGAQR